MDEKQHGKMRALVMAAQNMYIALYGQADSADAPNLRAMQHQRAIIDAADVLAEISEARARAQDCAERRRGGAGL